jgi:uncharacterized protein YcnI
MRKHIATIPVAAAAALAIAVPSALGHVGISAPKSEAGGYALATLSVPHGCEGKPTEKIEVKLPEGTMSAKPNRSPFWNVEVVMRELDEPMDVGHGGELTEVPDMVVYTAKTPLPDNELDLLPISLKLPSEEGRAFFPTIQTCPGGATSEWTTPAEEGDDEPESPAPFLTLTASSGDGHGGGSMEADGESGDHGDDEGSSSSDDLEDEIDSARMLGIGGIVAGVAGLLFGLIGMRRRK